MQCFPIAGTVNRALAYDSVRVKRKEWIWRGPRAGPWLPYCNRPWYRLHTICALLLTVHLSS